MDLRRLRTFVAVAEQGSVSKATECLRITQPALSRQIRDLQDQLGVKFFERVGRRLVLTGEGEEFLPHCRRLLSHADSLDDRARSLSHGNIGVLRVGATPQTIESVFPTFLKRYAKQCPHVHVRPIEAGAVDLLAILERGEIHLAIAVPESDEHRFASHPLPPVRVLMACTPSLRIKGNDVVDVRALAELPLLLLNSGFGTRKLFDAACRLARMEPNIFMESGAPHTLLSLAESGHGVAVVPNTVRIDKTRLRIACLAYRGEPLGTPLAVLWDKLRPLPRYAESFPPAFAAYMRQVFPISRPSDARGRRG